MKKERSYYTVSYSAIHNNRTTETKSFKLLRDAKSFAQGKMGYIIRHPKIKITYFGGFNPGATETNRIDNIIKQWEYS